MAALLPRPIGRSTAAASLLHQSELHVDCAANYAAGAWSDCPAAATSKHALCLCLCLAPWSSRKLATSVKASCVCNQMCINCRVVHVSQARPRKSVNTHLVPHAGRSSVTPDRMPTARVSSRPDSRVKASWRLRCQANDRCLIGGPGGREQARTHLDSGSASLTEIIRKLAGSIGASWQLRW